MKVKRVAVAAAVAAGAMCLAPAAASAQAALGAHDQAALSAHTQAALGAHDQAALSAHTQAALGAHDQAYVGGVHDQAISVGTHDQVPAQAVAGNREFPSPAVDGLVAAFVVLAGGAVWLRRGAHATQ
jgi:hypothetical protein